MILVVSYDKHAKQRGWMGFDKFITQFYESVGIVNWYIKYWGMEVDMRNEGNVVVVLTLVTA